MRSGSYPTIAQLNADFDSGRQVYEVGYVLGDFIATRWGSDAIVRLVQANGDIERVLGIAVGDFERRWYAFLEEKYLTPRGAVYPASSPTRTATTRSDPLERHGAPARNRPAAPPAAAALESTRR